MDTVAYCLERCGGPGAPADHATAFLPLDRRQAVLALLALHEELRRSSRTTPESGLLPARLGWWAEEIGRLHAGRPEHPVTQALQASPSPWLSTEAAARWVEAHGVHGERRRFADWPSLRDAATALVEPLSVALTRALGAPPNVAPGVVGLLATTELVAGIAGFRPDAERDRLNVPTDMLQAAGATPARILNGDDGAALARAMSTLAEQIRSYQRSVFRGLDPRPEIAPALVLSGLSIALLGELERDGLAVWHQRTVLTPLRMAWLAWRIRRLPRFSPAAG